MLTRTSRDFAWMSWVSNVVIFLLPLPLIAVLALSLRRRGGSHCGDCVCTLAFQAFLLLQRIHPMALLVLAIGAGVRVGAAVGVILGGGCRACERWPAEDDPRRKPRDLSFAAPAGRTGRPGRLAACRGRRPERDPPHT
jgi:hypothetical protein